MKNQYYLFLIISTFFILSFTNFENNTNIKLSNSSDSVIIAKIVNQTERLKDTIRLFGQYDYDINATLDTIKSFQDSLKHIQEKQYSEFKKAFESNKNISSFEDYMKQFNSLYISVNKINKDTVEIKEKLKKLNYSLFTLKSNRDIYFNFLNTSKKDVLNLISSIKAPVIFPIQFWNSKFEVVVVNNEYSDLKIFGNSSGKKQPLSSHSSAISKSNYGLLMNAGMYEENGSPVGLLISNRKIQHAINLKKGLPGNFYTLKNAIFYADTSGKFYVSTSDSFNLKYKTEKYNDISFATQSGPLLVSNGIINSELGFRSTNKLIRNGIGVVNNSKNNVSVILISETTTTFYEMAALFNFLGCENALYLDGTVSQLIYKGPNKESYRTSRSETQLLGPVFSVISRESLKENNTLKQKK
jgi:uncharacterized protein YigE (DUF2233 family)